MTGSQVGQSSSSGNGYSSSAVDRWAGASSFWRASLSPLHIRRPLLITSRDESSVMTCRLQDYRLLSVAMTKSLRGSSRCKVLAESYCYLMSRSAVI